MSCPDDLLMCVESEMLVWCCVGHLIFFLLCLRSEILRRDGEAAGDAAMPSPRSCAAGARGHHQRQRSETPSAALERFCAPLS